MHIDRYKNQADYKRQRSQFVAAGDVYALSSLLCGVIGIMFGLFVFWQLAQIAKSRVELSEVMQLASTVRTELAVEYAETGQWPQSSDSKVLSLGLSENEQFELEVADGAFTILIETPNFASERWSWNFQNGKHATLLWNCGHSSPLPWLGKSTQAATTLNALLLPSACRRSIEEAEYGY